MSPGQTGHITGQMGRVPGTDGMHTRGCPAKILYVYWFFLSGLFISPAHADKSHMVQRCAAELCASTQVEDTLQLLGEVA